MGVCVLVLVPFTTCVCGGGNENLVWGVCGVWLWFLRPPRPFITPRTLPTPVPKPTPGPCPHTHRHMHPPQPQPHPCVPPTPNPTHSHSRTHIDALAPPFSRPHQHSHAPTLLHKSHHHSGGMGGVLGCEAMKEVSGGIMWLWCGSRVCVCVCVCV